MNAQLRAPLYCDKCGKKLSADKAGMQCKTEDCVRAGVVYSYPDIKLRKV